MLVLHAGTGLLLLVGGDRAEAAQAAIGTRPRHGPTRGVVREGQETDAPYGL